MYHPTTYTHIYLNYFYAQHNGRLDVLRELLDVMFKQVKKLPNRSYFMISAAYVKHLTYIKGLWTGEHINETLNKTY